MSEEDYVCQNDLDVYYIQYYLKWDTDERLENEIQFWPVNARSFLPVPKKRNMYCVEEARKNKILHLE